MSMISEQISQLEELRDRIKELNGYWEMSTEKWAKIIDSAITIIKELSAKVASDSMERSSRYYNSRWIPCSERLPEPKTYVIACHADGIMVAYFENDWHWASEYFSNEKPPIAWMPLPKPYEEGNDD